MSGRFPGAANIETFWRNICEGVDSISRFRDDELEDSFARDVRESSDFVRARSCLEGVDQFDPAFFGISPRDAALTDPQHRVFLECAWEAIEDAGYDHTRYAGSIGVFAGCSLSTYLLRNVLHDRETAERFASEYQVGMYSELLGALTDTLATRVAYKLNLKGPAATVHTACSTSLFAVTQACQSLLLFQSDMVVAGGVSISVPQQRGYQYREGGMMSRDGYCRPFDAEASGTVFGSGAGAVLLKRLEDALSDGDHIYAVIRGSGVNNDGGDKAGFTAPSPAGQAAAITTAHMVAGVDPASIGYVETHGTATPLGDPLEFAGLCAAFSESETVRRPDQRTALGSVKANIGHLDAAAGVIALIKAALCLKHATIPALTNFTRPNPNIDLERSPFYVPTARSHWRHDEDRDATPRRAGVSSFGVGGTNVHIVLEEAPTLALATDTRPTTQAYALPLSAKTPAALTAQKLALAQHLENHLEVPLSAIAYTLQAGRRVFEQREVVVARSHAQAIEKLRAASKQALPLAQTRPDAVIFMFPGQGSQFAGMGKELYDTSSEFRAEIDRGAELVFAELGVDIREAWFAEAGSELSLSLAHTLHAQPALFILSHALAGVWKRLGVEPAAMVGHSVGEFVAAALAGVFTYEQALSFVIARARAIQRLPPGAMLAVRLSETELSARLALATLPGLDIAAVNAPNLCVAAGPFEAIERLEQALKQDGVQHTRLDTSHAFHSAMMADAAAELTETARSLQPQAPQIPYVSCVTGDWVTRETLQPEYFATHCRSTVRFAAALSTACAGRRPLLIQVGPGNALTALARQTLGADAHAITVASIVERRADSESLLEAAGKVWSQGFAIAFSAIAGEDQRVSLPTYPFERVRCWVDVPEKSPSHGLAASALERNPSENRPASASPLELPLMTATASVSRLPRLQAQLAAILQHVSGSPVGPADFDTHFLELGFDSLALGQVSTRIQQELKIKIGFRQLMGDFCSCTALAQHLDEKLP
ncbi:MAG: hypothetical protein RL701_7024, partial [Pseudomonadota bacterium]